MMIHVQWDNVERTCILVTYSGSWDLDKLHAATETIYHMVDSVPHTVDIIHDWHTHKQLPPNALVHVRNLIQRRHSRIGVIVLVGTDDTFTALWSVFANFYTVIVREHFLFTNTVEEARAFF